MTEYVYFIQADSGAVKIGKSSNVKRRLAAIKTAFPQRLTVLGVTENVDNLESRLHEKFATYRIKGEWFVSDDEVMRWAAENLRQFDVGAIMLQPVSGCEFTQNARNMLDRLAEYVMDDERCTKGDALQKVAVAAGVPYGLITNIRRKRSAGISASDFAAIHELYLEATTARIVALRAKVKAVLAECDLFKAVDVQISIEALDEAERALGSVPARAV